ncbi:MAG TPA: hypothetical protein VFP84_25320, partial [Kofleriaceae bacterium]|nr:hypothetical protein [Kofleriaceae bacterium]
GAAALVLMQRGGPGPATGSAAASEIAGVPLPKHAAFGKREVQTDGSIEPAELAKLYDSTLGALRAYAHTELPDPVDVLLAVPAKVLCEPKAYYVGQPPANCATADAAVSIDKGGTHRVMVVSDRARLMNALRKGVSQAACEFFPTEDNKRLGEICALTSRFAESAN